ncbi:hypothetical protein TraAM80_07397 [Trypanosoma rangeli]|uniref:Uncharacterized protein n=1 Tax=Trypanosoma rangeli TaxID=5698 RepID=A0A3R7M7C9_TRYRA|nr:uncharacterized protein TraAM80_07397 [Trypanosoma rangeli]RNF00813.1 hypothetical protein TraAM80_07397 [Trypanosoma rangeli]|eukprot:RNF00813.1 hypothetical protein TraAM80_07397 [Trypanosoma rangeli]
MASWDPGSYVAEALSRRIRAFARQEKYNSAPSYYDAVTNSLQAHEDSKCAAAVVERQLQQNVVIDVDVWGKPFTLVVNPRDVRGLLAAKKSVETIIEDSVKVTETISLELWNLNGKAGAITVSEELFGILNHVREMNLLTGNRFDPTSEGRRVSSCAQQEPSIVSELVVSDGFKIHWPKGMSLCIDEYMKAWFVDHVTIQLNTMNEFVGFLASYEGFARAFGHPRDSEVWKSGICGTSVNNEKRYITSLELSEEKSAIATQIAPRCFHDPFGLRSSTAICRTTTTAYCLSRTMAESGDNESALVFVHEWRSNHTPDSKEALFSFLFINSDEKYISDLTDATVGENDHLRLHLYDNKTHASQAHQQIERKMSYEECARKALLRSNCSDGFHCMTAERDGTLEKEIKKCFSRLPSPCVVASYVDSMEHVCVSPVFCMGFFEGDEKCTLCLAQTSPLYNHVYAIGARVTLNIFHSNGDVIYDNIQEEYPFWINQAENAACFFEYQGGRYVTTNVLKKECTQAVFITMESLLLGDQLFVIGRVLCDTPRNVLFKKGSLFYSTDLSLCEQINPVLFTTVHKFYGTVGLIGHGCHLCTLCPPIVVLYCPLESTGFVLDEKNSGNVCNITFPSREGGAVFFGKTYEELRSAIPVPASQVSSLPQESVAFRVKGRIVQTLTERLAKDVICVIAVMGISDINNDPLVLNVPSQCKVSEYNNEHVIQ